MKKIGRITFGGLQGKTVRLVQLMLLVAFAVFAAISYYQNRQLAHVVNEARIAQEQAISDISQQNVQALLEQSFVTTAALRADIADNDFSEVINYIYMLQTLSKGLFEGKDSLEPGSFSLPDPATDGTPSVHIMFDEGVDYANSEYLGVAAYLSDSLLAMFTNSTKLTSCYIGLEDGTFLCADTHTANRYDENGDLIPFPVTKRPWYRGAVETGGLYFTGIIEDAFSKELGITCSLPVYAKDELVGVVGADITLDKMNGFVRSSTENGGFAFIINDRGQVVLSPDHIEGFDVEKADMAVDLRETDNEAFSDFIKTALRENTGLHLITIPQGDYYMVGSPMPSVGWAVIMVVPKTLTDLPAQETLSQISLINEQARAEFYSGTKRTSRNTILLLIGLLLLGIAAAFLVAGRFVKPIEDMTRNITESSRTGKLFVMKDSYRTNDEIQVLAEAFDDLSKKTKKYIEDITRITKEKERISTELDLARKIQADMLPYIYPAFPDRPEFDIYATMNPAREVGGDFYDFFLIDKDHLGMVVADVSGKGVPAALFMMMSKILINNFAMLGNSPAQVLEMTNTTICQNNQEEMFVTAWFGILEISTGKVVAANAGHEYPILRKADGNFELFKDKHGFVLGGLEGTKYKEYEFHLDRGGALFLYTDGVPEAANPEFELYGVDRLIEALNQCRTGGPVELLTTVRDSVNRFVGDADQFDDLTMLGITLR